MSLFNTILLTILVVYAALCTVLFIYRKVVRLSYFWRSLGMIIFFVYTCRNFGVSWATISLLYLSACVLNFILSELFPLSLKAKSGGRYLTINTALVESSGFSYNKFKGHSSASSQVNQVESCYHEEERPNDVIKLSRLFLRVFVPLWLSYYIAVETFNKSFNPSDSFYSFTFNMKNKLNTIFKRIKVA
jgi:hypothetical protein